MSSFSSNHRPAVELRTGLGDVAVIVGVYQIPSFALWGARIGLEQNLDLHLAVRVSISCRPDRNPRELRGDKQAQSAAHHRPHPAAVHSWQLVNVPGGRGAPRLLGRGVSALC